MTSTTDRRRHAAAWSSILLALVATACASNASTGGGISGECSSNAQCASSQTCTYDVHQGCAAAGYCATRPTGACVSEYACNCSGATVPICLVGGEAPFAISHLGTCDGGVPAAYLPDASSTVPAPVDDAAAIP